MCCLSTFLFRTASLAVRNTILASLGQILNLRGEGGGLRSKNQILYVLTYLKIWNTRIQELFTELKNIDFRARTVALKSGRIAKCREM